MDRFRLSETLPIIKSVALNPGETLIGNNQNAKDSEWGQVEQGFNDLLHSAFQAQRGLFPPEAILVEGKPYEVFGVCACESTGCVYNSGKMTIPPMPFMQK